MHDLHPILMVLFQIPICMYHGTPTERAQLRKDVMRWVEEDGEVIGGVKRRTKKVGARKRSQRKAKSNAKKTKRKQDVSATAEVESTGLRRSGRTSTTTKTYVDTQDEEDEDEDQEDKNSDYHNTDSDDDMEDAKSPESDTDEIESVDSEEHKEQNAQDPKPNPQAAFPVILTTYEILMRDRQFLEKYRWGYIVVDEGAYNSVGFGRLISTDCRGDAGHRLKNFDCRLMREMKKLNSLGRLILSGTPLHVRPCFL
jgi:ATP-dependent DNA helicase